MINFHDALLMGFVLGPRSELRLEFLLDPVWNPDDSQRLVTLRCGAVGNYAAVSRFFGAIAVPADPYRAVAQVESLDQVALGLRLELDPQGCVEILSRKIETILGTSPRDAA